MTSNVENMLWIKHDVGAFEKNTSLIKSNSRDVCQLQEENYGFCWKLIMYYVCTWDGDTNLNINLVSYTTLELNYLSINPFIKV